MFDMLEEVSREQEYSSHTLNDTTVIIGLFVANVDKIVANAVAAGAIETKPANDYKYGYRQASIRYPFGHHRQIRKSILNWLRLFFKFFLYFLPAVSC